jgi:hypothetical protein
MPRKPPSTAPSVLQADAESDTPGLESQLAALDRYEAQQQREQSDEVAQVQEAWQARVNRARTLLEHITGTCAAYGATVDALSARSWSTIPSSSANLNAITQIERGCLKLTALWESATRDLTRLVNAHDKLSPTSLPNFHVNAPVYADYLRFHADVTTRIDALWHHLQHLVAVIAARLDDINDAEVYTPLSRLPQPAAAMTPQVEMA